MFLAPMPSVLAARRAGSLGELNPLPFPSLIGNCVAWIAYGIVVMVRKAGRGEQGRREGGGVDGDEGSAAHEGGRGDGDLPRSRAHTHARNAHVHARIHPRLIHALLARSFPALTFYPTNFFHAHSSEGARGGLMGARRLNESERGW